MATMSLILILVIAEMSGILSLGMVSGRLGDYTAAMAVVEAKVQDIRAASYNPPAYPFGSSTIYLTNANSIALNEAGTTFKVAGTVVSKIEPVGSAHLITVTGTFQSPNRPITVSLQTIVDKFSGGQQRSFPIVERFRDVTPGLALPLLSCWLPLLSPSS